MKDKQVIRITESDIHSIIKESVARIVRESVDDFGTQRFLQIGFANQFYTLWTTEIDRTTDNYGRVIEKVKHIYHKNISKDRETAFSKYPDADFDETLRGKTHSWEDAPKVTWNCVDVFRFGKYMGRKIDDITDDIGYIKWYYQNVNDEDHKKYIADCLNRQGYYLYNGDFYTKDEIESFEQRDRDTEKNLQDLVKIAQEGGSIDIFIEANPNDDGGVYDSQRDMWFYFENVSQRYYNGFTYYVPTINGKGKVVKNKTIKAKLRYENFDGWYVRNDISDDDGPFRVESVYPNPFTGEDYYNFEELYNELRNYVEETNQSIAVIKDSLTTVADYHKNSKGPRFYITDFAVLK